MSESTFSSSAPRAEVIGRRVAGVASVDRRDWRRRSGHFDIWLAEDGGDIVLRCRADNVSRSGAHAVVPVGSGLRRGQRYRLLICPASPWSGFGSGARLLGDATVVRTERPNDDRTDCVGVGLVFDVPVDWSIPAR